MSEITSQCLSVLDSKFLGTTINCCYKGFKGTNRHAQLLLRPKVITITTTFLQLCSLNPVPSALYKQQPMLVRLFYLIFSKLPFSARVVIQTK